MNTKEDILRENEINANKVLVIASFVLAIIVGITWYLTSIGVFYVYNLGQSRNVFFLLMTLPIIAAVIAIRNKMEKSWIKYMLMISVMMVCASVDMIYTYNVPLFIVIPIALSSRYFSKKYTIIITILTVLVFLGSAILGVYYGAVDLNTIELPEGTVINMRDETWLSDIFELGYVTYDKDLVLYNTLSFTFFTKVLQLFIIAVICVMTSGHERKLIFRQKDMSEQATRVETELDLAKKIQADMLPSNFPDRNEFNLYASMDPAREVGGDFYDFFMVDEDNLCLMIADVSGKGIPAAMFMMASKNIISSHVKLGISPAEALSASGADIANSNSEDMFVTVWLGILQLSTGRLVTANAGHEFPVLKRKDGTFEVIKDTHGFPVGWFPDTQYEERVIELKPGDKLFVYTDGVPEASNAEKEMFGMKRMVEALGSAADAKPKDILVAVRKSVDEFVGEAEQFDDLTMLAIEYFGVSGDEPVA